MVRLRRVMLGTAAAGAIGWTGWRRRALSGSGGVGAALVGSAVFGGGGPRWAAVLIAFFTGSSALSRLGASRKAALQSVAAKGSRRDAAQVLANGGVGAALGLAAARSDQAALFPAFVGAMAAVNSDTWSTEIGSLSRWAPRLITSGRPVPPGTSGGVTPLGLVAALSGGAAIGAVGGLAVLTDRSGRMSARRMVVLGAGAGLAGSLADSLLGATVQQVFYCPCCGVETERRVHTCGQATERLRGLTWVDNDVVNALASVVGAAVGAVIARR